MKNTVTTSTVLALALAFAATTGAFAGKADIITAPAAIVNSAGPDTSAREQAWIDGRRLELSGADAVSDGEKLVRSAGKAERKARQKLEKATLKSDEQRAAYQRLVTSFGAAETPYTVETEIRTLKQAADSWMDEYEKLEKAQERLAKAEADLSTGHSLIRNGREQIASGREKMRRAEFPVSPVANPGSAEAETELKAGL